MCGEHARSVYRAAYAVKGIPVTARVSAWENGHAVWLAPGGQRAQVDAFGYPLDGISRTVYCCCMGCDIKNRIRELRASKTLTQRAVAVATGVTVATVTNWEAGRIPDLSSAIKLADLFGVSLDWLVAGRGEKSRKRG